MNNPFSEEKYPDEMELTLVESAKKGNKEDLSKLIKAHQAWIFNITLKMVYDHEEAADITQDVLIKMITKLSTFKGNSKFRTWLYRIVVNHVLTMKKSTVEEMVISFEQYGNTLDEIVNEQLPEQNSFPVDRSLIVEEAKIGCMSGMLLCLDRQQRLIFILAELFNISDTVGSELLEISKSNFRKILSRARKDLYSFMNNKCGLVKKSNPCRCARKTKGFIELGIVDPDNLKFMKGYYDKIINISPEKSQRLEEAIENQYSELYMEHPFQKPPDFVSQLNEMLNNKDFMQLLDLGEEKYDT